MRIIIATVLFLPLLAWGEVTDRTGPYLAVGGGHTTFKDEGRLEAHTNNSNNGFFTAGAFINKYLSVEIALDYYDTITTDTNDNITDLYFFYIDTKAHYPFWKDRIDLFAAFGAGGVSWDERLNGVTQQDKSSALMVEAGVGIRVMPSLTFNMGYRRHFFTLIQEDLVGNENQQYKMEMSSLYGSIEVQF